MMLQLHIKSSITMLQMNVAMLQIIISYAICVMEAMFNTKLSINPCLQGNGCTQHDR